MTISFFDDDMLMMMMNSTPYTVRYGGTVQQKNNNNNTAQTYLHLYPPFPYLFYPYLCHFCAQTLFWKNVHQK